MASLTTLEYGTIKGRFMSLVGDSPLDVDDEPEALPMTGKIFIKPNVTALLVAEATPVPATVLPSTIEMTLDSEGYASYGGLRTVKVWATDSQKTNPINWTYSVSFDLAFLGKKIAYAGFDIAVPVGAVVDLTEVARVPTSSGSAIIRGPRGDAKVLILTPEEAALYPFGSVPPGTPDKTIIVRP